MWMDHGQSLIRREQTSSIEVERLSAPINNSFKIRLADYEQQQHGEGENAATRKRVYVGILNEIAFRFRFSSLFTRPSSAIVALRISVLVCRLTMVK